MFGPSTSGGVNLQGGSTNLVRNTASPIPVGTASAQSLQPTYNPQQTYNPQGGGATVNVQGASTGSYLGNTGGGGVTAPVADPFAQWGGAANYNRLVDGFNTQKSGIFDSADAAARNTGLGMKNSILDFIDSLRSTQSNLDNRGINNELAKQRGVADIYNAMNQGIRSGGVTLANRNASDSSAAEAIARAYGDIGRRQMSDVGNQYEMENVDIGLSQEDLNRQRAAGLRRFETSQEQALASIVNDAADKLSALDVAMANASLPERIALSQEKASLQSRVQNILAPFMSDLGQANSVQAMDANSRIAEATRRGALGQAPAARFDFSTETPVGLQGSGPVSSELPIFTYRNNEER